MRFLASFGLIAGLCVTAQASDLLLPSLPQPDDNAVENHILKPSAFAPGASAPAFRPDAAIAMPALPPDVTSIVRVDAPGLSQSARPQATAGVLNFALPSVPELPDAETAILTHRSPEAIRETTAAIPPAARDIAGAAEELPPPADPNALIAMLPPRAVAPSAPATPEPPRFEAPATPTLGPEALAQAFVTLGRLQGFSSALVETAREAHERQAQGLPLWTDRAGNSPGVSPRARAVMDTVKAAPSHGLAPARFAKLLTALESAGDAETREAALTLLALAYARDARGARLAPQQVSRLITATTTLPEPSEVLTHLFATPDSGAALESFNPAHPGYQALREKLAEIARAAPVAPEAAKLTFGPVLTLGMTDPRVPLLRERLGLPAAEDSTYDQALADAIRAFQREHRLRASGRLTRATVAALGGVAETDASSRNPAADIIANLERWRWLPTELGRDHVFVNIADFRLTLVRNETRAWSTRVIVGKPETQTPVFSHKMQFVVVNPSWNVPPSIALKEYLPLLQRNPQALSARGLQVVSRGRVVDPASVDWSKVGRTVAIRQPPGERNALGFIKFMFPNQHAVYLHDTPNRSLFANERRAYSHGCVRVQDPFRLAEAVMGEEWTESRLRGMIGRGERQINLPGELPVHLAYFTTFVDETGSLQTREDLYGHNRKVKALLGL